MTRFSRTDFLLLALWLVAGVVLFIIGGVNFFDLPAILQDESRLKLSGIEMLGGILLLTGLGFWVRWKW